MGINCTPSASSLQCDLRNYAAQVAIVKEMTGRNRAAKLEIVKQMSRHYHAAQQALIT